MTLHPTKNSSQIAAMGHEGDILEVQFHSGGHYRYENVDDDLYLRMRAAPSIGKFFGEHIKNNKAHPFTKLNP